MAQHRIVLPKNSPYISNPFYRRIGGKPGFIFTQDVYDWLKSQGLEHQSFARNITRNSYWTRSYGEYGKPVIVFGDREKATLFKLRFG